jgi:hypothetical protein
MAEERGRAVGGGGQDSAKKQHSAGSVVRAEVRRVRGVAITAVVTPSTTRKVRLLSFSSIVLIQTEIVATVGAGGNDFFSLDGFDAKRPCDLSEREESCPQSNKGV